MRRLAIIPARGGSKRIPDKNVRDFCGRPMMSHILGAARDSNLFSVIHVSTESQIICDMATRLGFAPHFPRPDYLADDDAPLMPVLRYVTSEYANREQFFDEVWLLMACAPLIRAEDLCRASAFFYGAGAGNSLLAVLEYPTPIEWAFRRASGGLLTPIQPGMFAVRSQDIEKSYYDAGCFAVFPSAHVLNSVGAGADSGFIGYVLPKGSSIDIDDEQDWIFAEDIWRARRITRTRVNQD